MSSQKAYVLVNRNSFNEINLSRPQIPYNSKSNEVIYDRRNIEDNILGYNTHIEKTYKTVPNSIRIVNYNLVKPDTPSYLPRKGGHLEYSRDTSSHHRENLIAAANGGAIINFK